MRMLLEAQGGQRAVGLTQIASMPTRPFYPTLQTHPHRRERDEARRRWWEQYKERLHDDLIIYKAVEVGMMWRLYPAQISMLKDRLGIERHHWSRLKMAGAT